MFHLFHSFIKTLSNQETGSLTPAQLKEGTGHQLPPTGQMIKLQIMSGETGTPYPLLPLPSGVPSTEALSCSSSMFSITPVPCREANVDPWSCCGDPLRCNPELLCGLMHSWQERDHSCCFPQLLPCTEHGKKHFQTPLLCLLPKTIHRDRTGCCNITESGYQQKEGEQGRMWDIE